jgi:hypothetical protein
MWYAITRIVWATPLIAPFLPCLSVKYAEIGPPNRFPSCAGRLRLLDTRPVVAKDFLFGSCRCFACQHSRCFLDGPQPKLPMAGGGKRIHVGADFCSKAPSEELVDSRYGFPAFHSVFLASFRRETIDSEPYDEDSGHTSPLHL